jgi:hypothetical protein
MAIFRVMNDVLPGRKIIIMLFVFMVPSFIYWTSGIHKDGLIFTGMSLIVYSIYFSLKEKRISLKRGLMIFLGLLVLLVLRNFLLIIIVPAILAWLLSIRWPKYTAAIFAGVYIVSITIFFTARYVQPRFDFPQAVVTKQQDFLKLGGGSAVPIKELEPNAISFLINIPQAINLSTIRPFPNDVKHILSLAAAVEIDLLLLMFLIFLFFRKDGLRSKQLIFFCIFFSVTLLLTIGFTVNNLGAIVRYRSIIIPLLIVPMAAQIDWKRLQKYLWSNIRNKNNVLNS